VRWKDSEYQKIDRERQAFVLQAANVSSPITKLLIIGNLIAVEHQGRLIIWHFITEERAR
jgi:hypothetical protein